MTDYQRMEWLEDNGKRGIVRFEPGDSGIKLSFLTIGGLHYVQAKTVRLAIEDAIEGQAPESVHR